MTKGIIYYTHNKCEERILLACRKQLEKCAKMYDMPIVSVSLFPIDFGQNVVVDYISSEMTMFRQILKALETINTDVVFHTEHDVLYHPSHFEFTPPRDDTYYYNINVWSVNVSDGQALFYDGMRMTSGLVANRKILIEGYTNKIYWTEKYGFSRRNIGFEVGRRESSETRKDDYKFECFKSPTPNVDIKHDYNITRKRFELSEYRCRRRINDSFTLADEIPYWGKTKGRFEAFLREQYYGDTDKNH